jgi:hypothetical protein
LSPLPAKPKVLLERATPAKVVAITRTEATSTALALRQFIEDPDTPNGPRSQAIRLADELSASAAGSPAALTARRESLAQSVSALVARNV